MATAIALPLSAINLNGGILPPSAITEHAPRHGRSRRASVKGRGHSYNVVEDLDHQIVKALTFVLKRTVQESELEEDEETDNLIADAEGWVPVEDVLEHPKIAALDVTLEKIQDLIAQATKARFTLRQVPGTEAQATDAEKPASFQIRRIITNRDSGVQTAVVTTAAAVPEGEPLRADAADLPDFVVFETSYHSYPLILASGGIKRASGMPHVALVPVTVPEDGTAPAVGDAEVAIWIDLRAALAAAPEIEWRRTEAADVVVTEAEIPRALWKKAIARRVDIGVLFEDGEVRKELPAGLRGKGGKGKAKSEKRALRNQAEDGSGSASEE